MVDVGKKCVKGEETKQGVHLFSTEHTTKFLPSSWGWGVLATEEPCVFKPSGGSSEFLIAAWSPAKSSNPIQNSIGFLMGWNLPCFWKPRLDADILEANIWYHRWVGKLHTVYLPENRIKYLHAFTLHFCQKQDTGSKPPEKSPWLTMSIAKFHANLVTH